MENNYLKWITTQTSSIYWNDSANLDEIDKALQNGATGVTTNPVIVANTLKSRPDYWSPILKNISPNLDGEALAMARTKAVVTHIAEKLRPIWEQNITGKGYVCAQVNPNFTFDKEYMIKWAKELQSWAPNISVKLPATKAGLGAYEECVSLGINVTGTIGFTVAQIVAMGEAHKRGLEQAAKNNVAPGLSIAVMMVGRLDDYLREVIRDSGLSIPEQSITKAGIACFKNAYEICREKGYGVYLMPAGLRSSEQITEVAGADIIMSIGPAIADQLAGCKCEERVNTSVDSSVIQQLSQSGEFKKAYDPEGLKPDEFITYGVVNRTTIGFIDNGWNLLTDKNLI